MLIAGKSPAAGAIRSSALVPRSSAARERSGLVARGVPLVQQLQELQAAAGNRAVSALLTPASVQRSPQSWARDTAQIVTLKKGKAKKSFWPPVVGLVNTYAQLPAGDLRSRAATLGLLETAISAWRENQRKNLTSNALDKKKATAVATLSTLIAAERTEMQQLAAPAAAPAPLPARAPAPATQPRAVAAVPRASAAVGIPIPMRPTAAPEATSWSPLSSPEEHETTAAQFDVELTTAPRPGDETPVETSARIPRPAAADPDRAAESESAEEGSPIGPGGGLGAAVRLLEAKGIRALPAGVYLRVHLTKPEHVAAITEQGLKGGAKKGIGLPETHEGDPAHVYALDLSNFDTTNFVSMEAGGGHVGLISTHEGDKDTNYPSGGAVRYGSMVPPIRGLGSSSAEKPSTAYSFPLPLTPRSSSALAQYVNDRLPPQDHMSADQVIDAVNLALVSHSVMSFASVVGPPRPPTHT